MTTTFVSTLEISPGGPFTTDEVTDVIERLIDVLDEYEVDPDISTTVVGDMLRVEITMHIDAPNVLQVQRAGLATLDTALNRANIIIHDFPLESVVRSTESRTLELA